MRSKFFASCAVVAVVIGAAVPAQAQTHGFDIPAQPLPAAIAALGKQAHVQIVAPADGIEHLRSRPVRGTLDTRVALRTLIAGTGLDVYADDGARIVLGRARGRHTDRAAAPSQETDRASPFETTDHTTAGADILVTGYRASLETARGIKRKSDAIVDVVAAEDIGQLPDNSATEALARLPGVQIFRNRGEGSSITIRGISSVMTALDGQEAYTGYSRRTLLNSYPASLIGSMEVYKALTPDLIEGGIGGAVNVRLRKPFDFPTGIRVAGSLRGSYEDQADKPFYNADLLVSGHWHTGIGEIGVLVNASYSHHDYVDTWRENLQPQTATGKITPTGLGPIRFPTGLLVKRPEGYYQRPVVTGELQWRPADNLLLHARVTNVTDINKYTDNDFQTNLTANTTLNNVVLVPGTNIVKSASFQVSSYSGPRSSFDRRLLDTTQIEWGADWTSGIATLSTSAVYTLSRINEDEQRILLSFNTAPTINAVFQSDTRYGGLSYGYAGNVDLNDINQYHVRAYSDERIRQKGSGLQWRTDLDLDTGPGFFRALKFGFRYADRSADYRHGADVPNLDSLKLPLSAFPGGTDTQIVSHGFLGNDAAIPGSWIGYRGSLLGDATNLSALSAYIRSLPGMSGYLTDDGRPADDPADGFTGTETSYATYGQFKYGLTLAGIPIDGVIGARIVNTVLDINGTQVTATRLPTSGGVYTYTYQPIRGHQNYVDVDPSASAVIHFTPGVQLRLAYTKTFSRPDFGQLNPSLSLTQRSFATGEYTGSATSGNPDLQPVRSENLDASLEYYFGRAGSASVAVFRRNVDGFIVNTIVGSSPEESLGLVNLTKPINAGKGRIEGVEFNANTFFTFLPGLLRNFGASGNYTRMSSSQDIPATPATAAFSGQTAGISRDSYNASLFYDDGTFRARVNYAWRSGFTLSYNLTNPANNLNWNPISRLDASAAYRFNRNITLTVDATNILRRPQSAYWGTAKQVDRVYYQGRTYSAALRVKF